MKYYYPEHLDGYARIKAEGKTAWGEIHGHEGFDNFPSRPFLLTALSRLHFSNPQPTALELGCGTGPGACLLAELGFRVDAVDLIPTAIEIAREMAAQRKLNIRFAVQDICDLPHDGPKYDLIVDSYCLQCIVKDDDRARVFAAVKARLTGYYVISTAYFAADHLSQETVVDGAVTYYLYKGDLLDITTFTVYRVLNDAPDEYPDAVQIAGQWYLPYRRHRPPACLRAELQAAGFRVLYQDGGHLICEKESLSSA
jgi:SAM-dependent methyltransferase